MPIFLTLFLFVVAAAAAAFAVVFLASRRPLSEEEARARLLAYFTKLTRRRRHPVSLQARIAAPGLDLAFGGGPPSATDAPVAPDQPFHVASIGKLFTAALVLRLAEQGRLGLDDPVAPYFPEAHLRGLFVVSGTDYAGSVTARHLLGHTSGIADYFEDAADDGSSFFDRVLAEPDAFWTPDALLEYARRRLRAVAVPGASFHYSDTGYILLGQLVERVAGRPFHEALRRDVFEPLGMTATYLLFHSEPTAAPPRPMREIWLNGKEISRYRSLSCDWAGGGIVSTPDDLIRFHRGLRSGALLGAEALREMETCERRFRPGLRYGLGAMEVRFEEFFPLLKGLPRLKGHIGVLATHLFCDPKTDTYIVLNFGSNRAMVQSFKTLIEIVATLRKMRVTTKPPRSSVG
ncbi:serine hydrolase domain-containing protein [Paenibacillus sp.]|uniref:serine hydrolase domain-containing protein n=1 Tax=Paenibacillus sp. TaxID=58172 RepID=UPI002D57C50A|nr:serine hydrolase domain-containing protein [Paenibacillus sp.]HZG55843.1 serine hydrolase domain-containing protein [Paenibacillus sp.]